MSKIINKLKENHLLLFLKMIPDMVSEYWVFTRETVRCNLSSSKSKQLTEILMLTHAIEKGFSLKNVRVDFGVAKIKTLVDLLSNYIKKYGYDDGLRVPFSLIYAYKRFREEHHNLTDELNSLFSEVDSLVLQKGCQRSDFSFAGTTIIRHHDMMNLENANFETLSNKRHAVRHFSNSGEVVDLDNALREAINMAKYSPSACNRQAYRVHVYKGEKKTRVLKVQGSNPFSEDAEMAIIITGDMNRYYSFEQHLMYVDASLFAMSLMFALTAKSIANIPLTQCQKRKTLNIIRKEFGIPKNEMPVIMIAIGQYPEEVKVARSERMEHTAFTTYH
jgi:nitroreductase